MRGHLVHRGRSFGEGRLYPKGQFPQEDPLTADSQRKPRRRVPSESSSSTTTPSRGKGYTRPWTWPNDVVVVGEAESGEEAVVTGGELTPDMVFMDVRMPGMDGIEATKAIRAASPTRGDPVHGRRVARLDLRGDPGGRLRLPPEGRLGGRAGERGPAGARGQGGDPPAADPGVHRGGRSLAEKRVEPPPLSKRERRSCRRSRTGRRPRRWRTSSGSRRTR